MVVDGAPCGRDTGMSAIGYGHTVRLWGCGGEPVLHLLNRASMFAGSDPVTTDSCARKIMDKASSQRMAEALLLLYFTPDELAALTPGEIRLLALLQCAERPATPGAVSPRSSQCVREHLRTAISAFAVLPMPPALAPPSGTHPQVDVPPDDGVADAAGTDPAGTSADPEES